LEKLQQQQYLGHYRFPAAAAAAAAQQSIEMLVQIWDHVQSHQGLTTGVVTGTCVLTASCGFTLYNDKQCDRLVICGYIKKLP